MMNSPYMQTITWARKAILIAAFIIGAMIILGKGPYPEVLNGETIGLFWLINSWAIFLVMLVRPLADITKWKWLRALIPMRKELGILSGMIVVMFGLAKYIDWGWVKFFEVYFSLDYWRFPDPVAFAHLGELVGVPLLLTSNLYSQKKLKQHWKTIQRLSYVYFYAGAYYVYKAFGATEEIWFMAIITILTLAAYSQKKWRKKA